MGVQIGQGFVRKRGSTGTFYGLVVGKHDALVDYIHVDRIHEDGRDRIRCYDDGDAVKEKDQHHVRLDSCPPPFSAFGSFKNWKGETRSNAVAFADMSNAKSLPLDLFENGICEIVDGGKKVSERDMNVIYNHPWASRMHREFLKKDFTELNKDETATCAFGVYNRRKLPNVNDSAFDDSFEYQ